MLRTVIFCPDAELAAHLERALLESRSAAVALTLSRYPEPDELDAVLRDGSVEAVFLSFESPYHFKSILAVLEARTPRIPAVAVCRDLGQAVLLELMRAGVREVVSPPFDPASLRETVNRILALLDRKTGVIERLYAFLPSKAGVGTSTIALNAGVALSHLPDTSVLLIDLDLNNGLIGFMLKLNSRYSVLDAIEHARRLDQDMWAKLVWPMGSLDVLPAGRLNPGVRIDPAELHPLLAFARRYYKVICVDLSGMMEKYSVEILREAGRIFLVCTPEVLSLRLGADKVKYLRTLELAGKVEILINRAQPRMVLSRAEIERMLGAPVRLSIPNDYPAVHEAMMAGKPLDRTSRLGRRFAELAASLMDLPAEPSPVSKRRFWDYLSPWLAGAPAREKA